MEQTTRVASSAPVAAGGADRDTAAKAICCMYGCGALDAHRRLDAYAPEIIAEMAEQERLGRRDRIPAILARAPKTRAKPRSKPNTSAGRK